jgi:hypothetical protein
MMLSDQFRVLHETDKHRVLSKKKKQLQQVQGAEKPKDRDGSA